MNINEVDLLSPPLKIERVILIMTFQPINHFNSEVYGHYSSICQTHILLDSVKQFITNYTYKAPFSIEFNSRYNKYVQKMMADYLKEQFGYKFMNKHEYDPFNMRTTDLRTEKFFIHLETPIIGESDSVKGNRPIFFRPVDQKQFNCFIYKPSPIENSQFYNEVMFYLHFMKKASSEETRSLYDEAEVVLFNKNDCHIYRLTYPYSLSYGMHLETSLNMIADMSQEMLASGGKIPITPSDKVKSYHCQNCNFFDICTYRKIDLEDEASISISTNNEAPIKVMEPDLIDAMETLYIAREMTKAAKELDDLAKDVIEAKVIEKGIKSIISDDYKLSVTSVTTNRLNSTSLKAELPDIYNKFTSESTSNRISISPNTPTPEKKSAYKKVETTTVLPINESSQTENQDPKPIKKKGRASKKESVEGMVIKDENPNSVR